MLRAHDDRRRRKSEYPAASLRVDATGYVERKSHLYRLALLGIASALREEAAAGDVSGETMVRLADLLSASVRREERELFPLIERTVSDGDLRALDLRSSLTTAADS